MGQVLAEARIGDRDRVIASERILQPVLAQVVADRNLAAERVAPPVEAELIEIVRAGLDQNRHAHVAEADRVGHALLIAEVGQADQDSVDPVAIAAQQFAAFLRIGPGLDRAQLRVLRRKPDRFDIDFRKQFDQVATRFADQHVREEVAVSEDHAKSRQGSHFTSPCLSMLSSNPSPSADRTRGRQIHCDRRGPCTPRRRFRVTTAKP